jgi:hypothetical protein
MMSGKPAPRNRLMKNEFNIVKLVLFSNTCQQHVSKQTTMNGKLVPRPCQGLYVITRSLESKTLMRRKPESSLGLTDP